GRAEVDVAAAHGQAVRLAHDGADDDLDREIQVAHHAADHDHLLGVFLAEVGALGSEGVEQLGHHGGDAAEVAGAVLALQGRGDFLDVHPGLKTRRVYVFGVRSPHQVDAARL